MTAVADHRLEAVVRRSYDPDFAKDAGRGWFPEDAEAHRRDAPRHCPACAAVLSVSEGGRGLAAGDVEGDGEREVFAGTGALRDGPGFGFTRWWQRGAADRVGPLATDDLDGDGRLDLVVFDRGRGELAGRACDRGAAVQHFGESRVALCSRGVAAARRRDRRLGGAAAARGQGGSGNRAPGGVSG